MLAEQGDRPGGALVCAGQEERGARHLQRHARCREESCRGHLRSAQEAGGGESRVASTRPVHPTRTDNNRISFEWRGFRGGPCPLGRRARVSGGVGTSDSTHSRGHRHNKHGLQGIDLCCSCSLT
eukprot:1186858-Pyramimonas_sp.AAC.1